MARKSATSLSVVPASAPAPLPPAPADLPTEEERALWRDIVESKPADWFGPDSLPILKEYIRAVATGNLLAAKIGAALDGDDASLIKFLLDMRDKEARRASSLATKLRLTQQSRYGARSADRANHRATGKRPWQT